MNATLAKSLGWLQFAITTFGQVFANGFPHNAAGWLPAVTSLLVAGASHAAASTDGAK